MLWFSENESEIVMTTILLSRKNWGLQKICMIQKWRNWEAKNHKFTLLPNNVFLNKKCTDFMRHTKKHQGMSSIRLGMFHLFSWLENDPVFEIPTLLKYDLILKVNLRKWSMLPFPRTFCMNKKSCSKDRDRALGSCKKVLDISIEKFLSKRMLRLK